MCSEQGSATVLTLALGLIICCAGMVSLLVIQLTLARSTLGSYADLAAIAAVQTGGDPCVAASLVSSRNGIELSACEVKDGQAIVEVRMPAPELLARFSHLKFLAVTARAGY
ncbi:MAG: flp pilus-assembly TadE/G-like family protein [Candidatus Nanopelagicales bacterium]|nr:flp pilus-assembly TadE/G-like family protein [Candidatus Nanopelagicales bacterium]